MKSPRLRVDFFLPMKHRVGIGYRKEFGKGFLQNETLNPDFVEVAPENWMNVGGYWKRELENIREKYPIYAHGLSLSIGSPDPIDWDFLKKLKHFLSEIDCPVYSEHLSFSQCSNAHLYDLLPIPFREDAVHHVAQRIREVQDYLERKLVVEIVSYYTPVAAEMSEVEFINAIQEEADCQLLFDINNIYVNAFNHSYDAKEFIDQLNLENVAYIHMAGHQKVSEDLIIDTHGHPIIDPVYELFDYALSKLENQVPVLLERDFNIPELSELEVEMNQLRSICHKHWPHEHATQSIH